MERFTSGGTITPVLAIAASAALFGISVPVLKLLVATVTPLFLVGLISLGSSAAILCLILLKGSCPVRGGRPGNREICRILGTVTIGGFLAPLIQYISLGMTPAFVASLLLNVEIVSTVAIAFLIFREPVNRRTLAALAAILLGSLLLSWDGGPVLQLSTGAAGIIVSCILWGLDNNFMANITTLTPGVLGFLKTLTGGILAGFLVILLHDPLPAGNYMALAFLTGFFALGIGLVLLIRGMQAIGAARTGALFAGVPFIGCIASLWVFRDTVGLRFVPALALFLAGAVLIITETQKGAASGERGM